MAQTKIEWTSVVWNPLVGCSRVSEGCRHCYAERQAFRAAAMGISRYDGLTKKVGGEIRWTGTVNMVESVLEKPLGWKKPRRIFVNSMSDLFHEKALTDWIRQIFSVMVRAPQHTFQILTKRPERMLDIVGDFRLWEWLSRHHRGQAPTLNWPLPNVWLGVSVEDQATADERIPLLLQTPAAVRWVSYEPALGPVDFERWMRPRFIPTGEKAPWGQDIEETRRLDWIVVGGESGPGARTFNLDWARQTIAQGQAGTIPVFVKQLGSVYQDGDQYRSSLHPKGGDPEAWPAALRVREYPADRG